MKFDISLDCHIWIDDVAKHLSNSELTEEKICAIRASLNNTATPSEICNNIELSLTHIRKKLGITHFNSNSFESLQSIQTKVNRFRDDITLINQLPADVAKQQLNILLLNFGALMYEIGIHNTAAQTNQAMKYGEKAKNDVTKGGIAVREKNNLFREVTIKIAQDFYKPSEHQTVKYAFVASAIKQLIRDHKKVSVSEGLIKKQIFEHVPAQAKAGGRPDKEALCKDIVQELILKKYSKLFG